MSSLKNRIRELESLKAYDIRQGWHHYQCLVCDDHSHHLGVHWESGSVRCLRCGYRTRLTGSGISVTREPIKTGIDLSGMYTRQGDTQSIMDSMVLSYAKDRDIGSPSYGWGVGRSEIIGNLVFPVVNAKGKTVYLQYRTSRSRWRSWGGGQPRLDLYPVIGMGYSPSILILNEGPIDALKVRKHTGLWSSPTFGADAGRNKKFIADIVRRKELKKILIWFDAEPVAEVKANSLMRTLRREVDADVVSVSWPFYSNEDQGESNKDRIMHVLGEYL